jgi:hypothetical protein
MLKPMRSLTLPPGLKDSSLPATRDFVILLSQTSGVWPTSSSIDAAIFMKVNRSVEQLLLK